MEESSIEANELLACCRKMAAPRDFPVLGDQFDRVFGSCFRDLADCLKFPGDFFHTSHLQVTLGQNYTQQILWLPEINTFAAGPTFFDPSPCCKVLQTYLSSCFQPGSLPESGSQPRQATAGIKSESLLLRFFYVNAERWVVNLAFPYFPLSGN